MPLFRMTNKRGFTVSAAVALGAASLMMSPTVGHAAVSTCQATDLTSGAAATADLQAVIDAATAGDTVQVEGVCTGGFSIDKDLTLVGQAAPGVSKATLDGNGVSRVLSLGGGSGVEVLLTDLTITNGFTGTYGGGIRNSTGAVTLSGSTSVAGNTADQGGGIFSEGRVTLNGSSSVSNNTADFVAGGIAVLTGALTLSDSSTVAGNVSHFSTGGIGVNEGSAEFNDSSSVTGNTVIVHGGVFTGYGGLTMNDSSSVSGNIASFGGAGISNYRGTVTLNDASLVSDNSVGREGSRARGQATEIGSLRLSGDRASVGGGIFNLRGSVRLNDAAEVSGNAARRGGGIFNKRGTIWLNGSSSVTGNTSRRRGGGIFSRHPLGVITLAGMSSVAGNTARIEGGGVFVKAGVLAACSASGIDEWVGAISPNTPDDELTPERVSCP